MKAAITWVSDAMSNKDLSASLSHFLIDRGMIYATDGRMTAAHPFPHDDTFCVSGPEFIKLISRLQEPIDLTVEEGSVTLRQGRLHGTIKTLDPSEWQMAGINTPWLRLPERMLPALRQLRPFISDNATKMWALCVLAENDTLYATNNVSICAVPEIDLDGTKALIPYWAIDFILARQEGIADWTHHENYLGFRWSNGAWMRTKLGDDNFPAVEDIISGAGHATYEIDKEWRSAFEEAASLLKEAEAIIFEPDCITGTSKNMTVEVQAKTKAPECGYSAWSVEYLEPVIKCATHWQPDAYPNPSAFRGDGLVGVVMGRKVRR